MSPPVFPNSQSLATSPDQPAVLARHKERLDAVIAAAGRVFLGKERAPRYGASSTPDGLDALRRAVRHFHP